MLPESFSYFCGKIQIMKFEAEVKARSNGKCEVCDATENLSVYEVQGNENSGSSSLLMICGKCLSQVEKREEPDAAHWQKALPTAMWSEIPAVKVLSWRMLNRFRAEAWATEMLDMMYMEEAELEWAKVSGDHVAEGGVELHRDSNGAVLQNGDTVVLTKSLDVKGSSVNARVGTVVKNIRLVNDNTEQIEGRIEGQLIVILTKYLRKHN